MTEKTDFQLIEEFNNGSEPAFNEIANRYQSKIYWHARRMLGNHLDADEVTQEVLIVLYKKLKTFKFNSALFTWIYRITSTRSLNQIRKRKVKRFLFLDDDEALELKGNNDPVSDVDNKEKLERLNKILEKIPVKQREVFIMRHFDEMSYEEISEVTGKSVGGLKANYHHALKKIMEMNDEKI